MSDPQLVGVRSTDQHDKRRSRTTAPGPEPHQDSGPDSIEGWVLYTVWARWSAASVRVRSLLQQLVQDGALPVAVADLDVDQDPEEVRRLGVTVVPSLILARDGSAVSRLKGEVGAVDIKSWLQTIVDTH